MPWEAHIKLAIPSRPKAISNLCSMCCHWCRQWGKTVTLGSDSFYCWLQTDHAPSLVWMRITELGQMNLGLPAEKSLASSTWHCSSYTRPFKQNSSCLSSRKKIVTSPTKICFMCLAWQCTKKLKSEHSWKDKNTSIFLSKYPTMYSRDKDLISVASV